MESLLETAVAAQILDRLTKLEEGMKPKWGKMSVGQMVWHCQVPLRYAIENKAPKKKPNPLIQLLFKKSMYSDKPWRKNLPTSPVARAQDPKELKTELPELSNLVKEFQTLKDRKNWNAHPLFGVLTPEQWGQMQFKHLDHHLRQFGV